MRALFRRMVATMFYLNVIVAVAAAGEGPGFDPTPVRLSNVEKFARRPPTTMDLLTIRDLKGVCISPDGKYVAFVVGEAVYETNSYRSGMFLIKTTQDSTPVSLGSAGLPHFDDINQWSPESPQWSRDSRYVMYRARMSSAESWQVWRWSIHGGSPVRLTNVPGDVQDYRWSPDGSTLHMTVATPRDPTQAKKVSDDGFVYDGGFPVYRGRPVVREFLEATPRLTETWSHNIETGAEEKEASTETESPSSWMKDIERSRLVDAKVSPDGQRVAYRYVNEKPDGKSLYILYSKPVQGGFAIDVAPDAYYVSDYWWSADSTAIFYAGNTGDGRGAKILRVSSNGGNTSEVYGGSELLYFDSIDDAHQNMACANENAASPARIALLDLRTGSLRILLDLNPEFENIDLGTITKLEGINKFGDKWFAHLVKPLKYQPGKRYPLIVTTYTSGDGFLRGASGDENPIHVYSAYGFAVLSFDIGPRTRLVHRPGDFEGYLSWFASETASIEMAVAKASDVGIADLEQMGLTGYSRGSELARYVITHNNRFRAISGAAGDESPYFYYMSGPNQGQFSRSGLGGWPEGKSKANWKQVAPDLNADLIAAPILNNDPDSEVLGDLALYTSLKELGKPIELVIYPDELHHISQPKHRYQMYERNLEWFRFWLKNEESSDPTKATQYARWRKLRKLQQQSQSKSGPDLNSNDHTLNGARRVSIAADQNCSWQEERFAYGRARQRSD